MYRLLNFFTREHHTGARTGRALHRFYFPGPWIPALTARRSTILRLQHKKRLFRFSSYEGNAVSTYLFSLRDQFSPLCRSFPRHLYATSCRDSPLRAPDGYTSGSMLCVFLFPPLDVVPLSSTRLAISVKSSEDTISCWMTTRFPIPTSLPLKAALWRRPAWRT